MQSRALPAVILFALITAPVLAADVPAAQFKDGHWQPIAPPPVAPVIGPEPELDHMQQLLDVKDAKAALVIGINWVKSHTSKATSRDRCLYLIAQAKFKTDTGDDRISSFYYLDELMDEYPESKLFYPALQLQFTIAQEYLDGHKGYLLGLPIVGMEEEAVEMLYRIQQRSPGSPLSEKALLRTCDYYYSTGEYELAHDAYGFFIKNYPRSPLNAQVMLRKAFASLAQFRGVRFDPTCMVDARAELLDVIAAYPALAREENLAAIVENIDKSLSRKLLVTADYYRRTHALRGAVYVYRYLIDTYPESTDAAEAKKMLAAMPKSALDDLPPHRGEDFAIPLGPPAPGKGT